MNEVQDILAADRQLAAEVEFDLRRFEQEQREREEEEAARFQPAEAQLPAAAKERRSLASTPSLVSSSSKESVVSRGSGGSGSAVSLTTPKSNGGLREGGSLRKKILTDVLKKRDSMSRTPSRSPLGTPTRLAQRTPTSTPSRSRTGDSDTGGQGCAEKEQVNMEATPSEEVAAQVAEDMESSPPENNLEPQQKPACSEAEIDQLVRNKEPSTSGGTPAKMPSENEDKSLAKVNRKTTPHEIGDE